MAEDKFNVMELTKKLFVAHTSPDNEMPSKVKYIDEKVGKSRQDTVQTKVFDICNEEDTNLFLIDEDLKNELMEALTEASDTEISQFQLYRNESTNSYLVYLKTDDCYAMVEMLLVVTPDDWCAVINNCSRPFVASNHFTYEGSKETLQDDFGVSAERSTFDALLLAAEKHFQDFSGNFFGGNKEEKQEE
jgi:hypothetical protein